MVQVMEVISRPILKRKSPSLKMTTRPNRASKKHLDNRYVANTEVMLSSFASLLSSAVTNGVEHPLLSSEDPTLSRLLADDPTNNDEMPLLSFSGLSLRNGNGNTANNSNRRNSSSTTSGINNSSSSSSSIQDVAAHSLATTINADLSTIDSIPSQLLQNLTGSLKRLIDSRMRSSFAALLRTMKGGIDDSIMRLLLVTLDPIRITTVVTSFTVITTSSQGDTQSRGSPSVENQNSIDNSVTIPLILEAIIDAKVLSKMVNLTLHAPGTITGTINPNNMLLTSVNVAFDTMALLKSMMSQARVIVKKGIREAAYIRASFRKNAELNGMEGLIDCTRSLQDLYQLPPPYDRVNDDSINNPTSQHTANVSSSSKATAGSTMQEKLLTSYPSHLRQTVEHFLPAMENSDSVSIEGFPSHLAKTLLSLSKPSPSPSNSSGNEGVDGNRSMSGGRGGSSSESSNQGEGMQAQHQRQNNSSKHKTNDNTLINKGEKRHSSQANEGSWTQRTQLTSFSTAIENNNNNNHQGHGQNAALTSGVLSLSHPIDSEQSTCHITMGCRIHQDNSSLPSSTNPPPSSNNENENDEHGYDNTNHMGAPIGTEHPTSIQQSNNPPSK